MRLSLSEGLGSAALKNAVLLVVSEPNLMVARMVSVGLNGTHGMAYGAGTGDTSMR